MKHMANVRLDLLMFIPAVTSGTYLTLGMLLKIIKCQAPILSPNPDPLCDWTHTHHAESKIEIFPFYANLYTKTHSYSLKFTFFLWILFVKIFRFSLKLQFLRTL